MGQLLRWIVLLLCAALGVVLALAMASAPPPSEPPEGRAFDASPAAAARPQAREDRRSQRPIAPAGVPGLSPAPPTPAVPDVRQRGAVGAHGSVIPVGAELPVGPSTDRPAARTVAPLILPDGMELEPIPPQGMSEIDAGLRPAGLATAPPSPAASRSLGSGPPQAQPGGPVPHASLAHGRDDSRPSRPSQPAASDAGPPDRGTARDPESQTRVPAIAASGSQASGGHSPGTAAAQRSTTGHFSIARAAARQPAAATPGLREGDEHLNIYIKDKDVREVLALLAEQGGLNILPTKSVSGTVSLSLSGVTIDEALQAILKSTGLVARRDSKFVYVGTPQDFDTHAQALDRVGTRIYRPNYVRAADLETIIAPLLTPGVGVIKASAPASVGIAPDANGAGGDALASGEALLVQDFQSILDRVDAIVREIDRKPPQVAIEAMILSVELSDKHSLGVDWQFLRNQGTIRFALGSPAPTLNDVQLNEGGLKFAFLDSNLGVFLKALEEIGDTNVIATPRLLVLNKQRAEILIGAQLGYVNTTVTETSATQSVEFLEIGTQLRIRPFISGDGNIRMEIHPELSTGNVRVEQGITLPDKEVTSVTTNILVQDGSTVIIGGLVREDLVTTARQVPLVGNLPWVGALFRTKEEKTVRNEILVLVTPRIVGEPQLGDEGHTAACEFHRRQAVYADKMSPIGKRYLARRHFHLAQEAWAVGDARTALEHIEVAIHIDPMNRAAIDLRADILAGRRIGSHTIPSASQVLPHEPSVLPAPVREGPAPVPDTR